MVRIFSPRVQEIRKTTEGPIAAGSVFQSKIKDAGMTARRRFELTAFEAPTKIRWTERSKNVITVPDGGYDLETARSLAARSVQRDPWQREMPSGVHGPCEYVN